MDEIYKQIEILLVEDSPADVRFIIEAFKQTKVLNKLNVVGDGAKAMTYLQKKTSMPTPHGQI